MQRRKCAHLDCGCEIDSQAYSFCSSHCEHDSSVERGLGDELTGCHCGHPECGGDGIRDEEDDERE